jgi:hypothetical protein
VSTTGTVADVCPELNASKGTWALTYGCLPVGETETIGAVTPLKVTLTPLSEGGRDVVLKLAACVESCEVKMATRAPGATGDPAPFT